MRFLLAFLLLGPVALAAPVPKSPEKPRLELTVAARIAPQELTITVKNHGKEDIESPYNSLPIELFEIEVRNKQGEVVPCINPAMLSSILKRDTLKVPAGGSVEVELRLIRGLFGEAERPQGKFSVLVRLKHEGKTYESPALMVEG